MSSAQSIRVCNFDSAGLPASCNAAGWNVIRSLNVSKELNDQVLSMMNIQIHKLMSKVEDIYTKHFTEGERKKAISQLRPTRKQGTHRTTFALGSKSSRAGYKWHREPSFNCYYLKVSHAFRVLAD